MTFGRLAFWVLTASLLSGCAKPHLSPDTKEPPPKRAAVVVRKLPLADYIPGAGLRWLVQIRPSQLMNHPDFAEDWGVVFEADRLRAFARASGVDSTQVSEAWIAGYDLGVLYVLDASTTGHDAQAAFEARALTSSEVSTPYDNMVHLTGIIQKTPHAMLHVQGHMVAIASGDIGLIRIAQAYAEEKIKKSPSALRTSLLAQHAKFQMDAPVRAFLRGPFEDATDAVSSGFLSGVAAVRFEEGELRLKAQALGAWPTGPDLNSQMSRWTDQVLSTRELRALGWGFPTTPPEVMCQPDPQDLALCSASGAWDSRAVAEALHRIIAGSMADLVEKTPRNWHPEATTQPSPEEESE